MQDVTRRSLIGQAFAAGAGATVVSSVELTDPVGAQPSNDRAAGYDPDYLAGTILSRQRNDRFVVRGDDGSKEVIRVADPSVVWKKGTQGQFPLRPGDHVRARGRRAAGGSLAVLAAWVDILSFQAKVVNAERSQFDVELPRWPGRHVPIRVQANSAVGKQGGGAVQGDASHLRTDDALQVIGYGDPAKRNFVATRVFAFEPPGASPSPGAEATLPSRGPRPASSGALCQHYWYGIASWFDCSVGACDGNCPRCNSNYNQMAWPRLRYCCGCGECIADCGGNVCGATCCTRPRLPTVRCGTTVPIYDVCTHKSVRCVVTDCGPCVRCVSPYGCQGFRTVKFDLTAAAYSKVAGLNSGLASVRATTYSSC